MNPSASTPQPLRPIAPAAQSFRFDKLPKAPKVPPRIRHSVASIACVACRHRRTKCSGTAPCEKCCEKAIECVFADKKAIVARQTQELRDSQAALSGLFNALSIADESALRDIQQAARQCYTSGDFLHNILKPDFEVLRTIRRRATWDSGFREQQRSPAQSFTGVASPLSSQQAFSRTRSIDILPAVDVALPSAAKLADTVLPGRQARNASDASDTGQSVLSVLSSISSAATMDSWLQVRWPDEAGPPDTPYEDVSSVGTPCVQPEQRHFQASFFPPGPFDIESWQQPNVQGPFASTFALPGISEAKGIFSHGAAHASSQLLEHDLFPLPRREDKTQLGKVYQSYREAALEMIANGTPAPHILGDPGNIDVELLFRDRREDDCFTVCNFASEVVRKCDNQSSCVQLVAAAMLTFSMRWLILPTAANYAQCPEAVKPALSALLNAPGSETSVDSRALGGVVSTASVADSNGDMVLADRSGTLASLSTSSSIVQRMSQLASLHSHDRPPAAAEEDCRWTYGLDRAVEVDSQTGRRKLTREFMEHAVYGGLAEIALP